MILAACFGGGYLQNKLRVSLKTPWRAPKPILVTKIIAKIHLSDQKINIFRPYLEVSVGNHQTPCGHLPNR